MAVVLKLKYQGELRRVRLLEDVKFEDIREGIQKAFPGVDTNTICMKYIDEDGDRCTLCPGTLSDCMAHAVDISGQKLVKLELDPAKTENHVAIAPTTPAGHALHESLPAVAANADMQDGWENITKLWGQATEQWMGHAAEMDSSTSSCCGGYSGWNQDWVLKPKKMIWILSSLRANGALNSKTVASMLVSFLPRLIAKLPQQSEKVDWKVAKNKTHLRPVLKDLAELVSRTPGLEHCGAKLNAVVQDALPGQATFCASEALLALCVALNGLPFDAKIDFAETFYNSQEDNISKFLVHADGRRPFWASSPLEHGSITCDGCNMHPLKGPRFKCLACPNYDLCGKCFTRKGSADGGAHADHEFKCIVAVWGAWKKRKCEPFIGAAKAMEGLFGEDSGCSDKGNWTGFIGKGMGCKGKGNWIPWERDGFDIKNKGKCDMMGKGFDGKGEGARYMKGKGKGKLFGKRWSCTW